MRRSKPRGFTLVEMAVTIAIIGIVTVLAYDAMGRAKPRATFDSVSAEMQSLIHQARQTALAQGVDVGVMVFPDFENGHGKGRVVVIQDAPPPAAPFFPDGFGGYDPAKLVAPTGGEVVATLDLPPGVLVGPAGGLGTAALPFPYDNIATGVACSFCDDGGDRRGAIVFNGYGRSRFYKRTDSVDDGNGGHSFSIYGTDLGAGATFTTSTLVITRPQGMVRTFHNG